MRRSIQRVPRVGFGLEQQPARRARREIAGMLERHLSKRFGPVRSFRRYFLPVSLLMLNVNGNNFVASIARERLKGQDDGEWCVAVNPLDYPVPKKNLPEDEERKYARDLMLISDEIQTLLTNTPGVTRLRWFFEGWDVDKPGVRDPAELPWHVDVPELRATQGRKMS